jgi:predicted Zn finger-like uncharacterized protein
MRWTCPKCGKKLDVSNEQLIANDGVIVCPQCLLQARQPIPQKRVTTSVNTSSTPPPRKSNQVENTPPPHKTRMKQASTSYRYTGPGSGSNGTTKKRPVKKKSKKKKQAGMSAWGCFGKSVIFTLILFAAYVFFGLLLESIQ